MSSSDTPIAPVGNIDPADGARNAPADRRARARRFNLTRWFALLSFVCISAACAILSSFLSRFLTASLLERDAQVMMEVVQSIAEVQDTSGSFLGGNTDVRERRLEEFFAHISKLPDVLRANIYALDQKVLWSSDSSLIGTYLGPNHELEEALHGKVEIESGVIGESDHVKPEHRRLMSREPRFVENYLPVRAQAGGAVIGVVEVYRVPAALFEKIAEGIRLIWAIALVSGGFLFLALFGIVRRADRLIEAQSARLLETETLAVVGEMTAAIAHGIRNPLASIRSSAELCQDDPSPATREAARDITGEVDRLTEWVRQLLTYAEQEPARLDAVALAPLFEASLAGFERERKRRGVELRIAIDPALPLVLGERVRLMHALNSLLANALEAMPNGGLLEVEAKPARRARRVEITIRDTGIGIPREQLPRVFAPFFTSKRKGLGLGLPLVRRIVNRFGGSVSIDSDAGKGTCVVVELPAATS